MNNSRHGTMDLTTGTPIRQIFIFAVPLIFGTLFQQLYSFADTVIVGRFLGMSALGALGATYSLNFLILGFIQGFCVGLGIPLAGSFGAKDATELHRYFWNGAWLCVLISVLFTSSMLLLARPLLLLMHTPEDLLETAVLYILIIFGGIPASVLYNFSASALRAVGDSRHPFYFLLFSSLLNIVLDYVLIVYASMGIAGAAGATVFSQLVSGLLNTWWLMAKSGAYHPHRSDMTLSAAHIKKLCRIALPMGFEYSVSAIGAVIMQNAINTLGSVAVTAQATGEKIRQMFTLPMESVGMAMATYTGQNYGAGNWDRIRRGIRSGLTIQAIYCAAAWGIIFLLKYPLVSLVTGETVSQEAQGAVQYLQIMSCLFLIHGALMVFRNVLQGMGHSLQSVLSGAGELLGRALGGAVAIRLSSFTAICFTNPLAWGFALCYCVVMVTRALRSPGRRSTPAETTA